MTNTRVQPQDLESEKSLLGSMMLSKDAVAVVIGKLDQESFYKPAHGIIFDAIVTLFNANDPIDLITVSNQLKKSNALQSVGGRAYLIELTDTVPTAANADYYADIIFEKFTMRKLIDTGATIIKDAYDDASEPKEVLDEAQKKIMDLSKLGVKENFIKLKEALNTVFEKIQTHDAGEKLLGISTGYPDLDSMTSGFQPGDLIILAARPSMGKTTLALNFAQSIAIQKKTGVAIFSCEMPSEQLAMRLLCSEAKLDSKRLRTASLADHEYRDLNMAFGRLSDCLLYTSPSPRDVEESRMPSSA